MHKQGAYSVHSSQFFGKELRDRKPHPTNHTHFRLVNCQSVAPASVESNLGKVKVSPFLNFLAILQLHQEHKNY